MARRLTRIGPMVAAISERARERRPVLVAVSGIDGSGKGTIAARVAAELEGGGMRVARIALDPWHHPAEVRFNDVDPGPHFFEHAFRFEELFALLIDPLRRDGSVRVAVDLLEPFRNEWYAHVYAFKGVDVILLEGIFLLKQEWRGRYDSTFWVECPFGTALKRVLRRNQEGLPPGRLIADYARIYFPAQRVHLARDRPKAFVDAIYLND